MSSPEIELESLAASLVERARRAGADVAEAKAQSGWELTVRVRLGEPELVQEAGSRAVSLRVMKGGRVALTSTSDVSETGLARAVADAMELVELSEVDPFAGPADPAFLSKPPYPDSRSPRPRCRKRRRRTSVGYRDACGTSGARVRSAHYPQRGSLFLARHRAFRAGPVGRVHRNECRLLRIASGCTGRDGRRRQATPRTLLVGATSPLGPRDRGERRGRGRATNPPPARTEKSRDLRGANCVFT